MAADAIQLLQQLQIKFDEMDRSHPELRHVIQGGQINEFPWLIDSRLSPASRAELRIEQRHDHYKVSHINDVLNEAYERGGGQAEFKMQRVMQSYEFAILKNWIPAAEQAGRAIVDLPEAAKQNLPKGVGDRISDGTYADWFAWCVHAIGWECRLGLPLHIKRVSPVAIPDVTDNKERDAMRWGLLGRKERLVYNPYDPKSSTYYQSTTPHSLFRCAVYAIDAILIGIPLVGPKISAAGSRKGGRPKDTDPKEDKGISDAWATGMYKTFDECASALGLTGKGGHLIVKRAVDRHRKRQDAAAGKP